MTAAAAAHAVTATPGTTPATGVWANVSVTTETTGKLRVNGRPLLLGAKGSFHFTPAPNSGSPLDSTVDLAPAATRLRDGGRPVLRVDESRRDTYGNTLTAGTPGPLRTEPRPA